MFVIRGVRLFFGPAGQWDRAVGRPLLEVQCLCGLLLGGDYEVEERELCRRDGGQFRKQNPRLRLVTVSGAKVGGLGQPVDPPGDDKGVVSDHAAHRESASAVGKQAMP